jgi:transcription antitermination factor NusG
MALLAEECHVYPENLLDGGPDTANGSHAWFAVYTKARAEKALARKLHRRDVSFFLPVYKRHWQSSGRRRIACLPLFPGYVFARGDDRARLHVLETNLVSRLLPVADQGRLHADLARVHQLFATGAALTPEGRLEPGTLVEITHGALTGVQGRILTQGKRQKFVVQVEFLKQGVSMEIDGWMIRPVL